MRKKDYKNTFSMKTINECTFEYTFLGDKMIAHTRAENLKKYMETTKHKCMTAFNLIPNNAELVLKKDIKNYKGKLMSGILADSLYMVHGLTTYHGIVGYCCSVFYVPTKKELKKIIVKKRK